MDFMDSNVKIQKKMVNNNPANDTNCEGLIPQEGFFVGDSFAIKERKTIGSYACSAQH